LEAAKIASLAINPARAEIQSGIAAAETARANRVRATEGVARAVGELSAGDAEALRAAYGDAAKTIGAYGAAFTGDMRARQEAGAAQAGELVSRLGLPGTVTTDAPANANVTEMVGAAIPGGALAAQAPLVLAQAQAHRSAIGARLADELSQADFKAGGQADELRAEIAKLEAKRPGLITEALDHIRAQANAKRATDTQIGYLQLQQAKTVQDRAVAMTNLTGTIHVVVGKGKGAHVVDTGRSAAGSDAAISQVKAATSRANAATSAPSGKSRRRR